MRTYNGKVETSLWHCSIGICEGCHYYGYDRGEDCMKQLIKEAYQAHLSDERDLENQLRKIKELNAEVERLKAESDMADGYEGALVEMTKSEAIKEFAERLKEMKLNKQVLRLPLLDLDIDNLVKEMVGE